MTALLLTVLMQAPIATDAKHIVFLAGDHEYRSEITMPMLARLLERQGFRCTVLVSRNENGEADGSADHDLTGLDTLKTADAAVFFLRWRTLPEEGMRRIIEFVNSGKPMLGFRTTTHAFRASPGEFARWDDDFGHDIFGQKWLTHHGHASSTDVTIAPSACEHAILRGIRARFHVRSWLYHVEPVFGNGITRLLLGTAIESDKRHDPLYPPTQPVAWTKAYTGSSGTPSRVFFTTLGHPQDFAEESVRRMFVNAVYWALGQESAIPAQGSRVDLDQPYEPPDTH